MTYDARQGDVVWVSLDPTLGHEQNGRRPAIIVSNDDTNRFIAPLAVVCPITTTFRNYPTRVALDDGSGVKGFVVCEQPRTIDLSKRKVEFGGRASRSVMMEISDILLGMFEIVDKQGETHLMLT